MDEHTNKDDFPTRSARRGALAAVAVMVFLVVEGLLAFLLISGTPDNEPRPAAAAASPAASPSTSRILPSPTPTTPGPAEVKAAAEALEQCRLSNLRQQSALSSGSLSMSMWDKHIEAMNLLVADKITLAVARDFWESSRVGAMEAVAAFQAADGDYLARSGSGCAPLSSATAAAATPADTQSMARCLASMRTGDAVLAQARPAVRTWEHHIHDMEALRKGDITPKQATTMWLRNWKVGQAQLDKFDRAVAANTGPGCQLR